MNDPIFSYFGKFGVRPQTIMDALKRIKRQSNGAIADPYANIVGFLPPRPVGEPAVRHVDGLDDIVLHGRIDCGFLLASLPFQRKDQNLDRHPVEDCE